MPRSGEQALPDRVRMYGAAVVPGKGEMRVPAFSAKCRSFAIDLPKYLARSLTARGRRPPIVIGVRFFRVPSARTGPYEGMVTVRKVEGRRTFPSLPT